VAWIAVCDQIKNADIFLVIGTSLSVAPASHLIDYAHPSIPKFFINTEYVSIPDDMEFINAKSNGWNRCFYRQSYRIDFISIISSTIGGHSRKLSFV